MEKSSVSSNNSRSGVSDWKEKSFSHVKNFCTKKKLSECPEASSNLLKKKENIEKKITLQLEEIKQMKKELNIIESKRDECLIKYKCELYELITNITWDLHSLQNDVKGYVSKPLNVFDLNTKIHSNFYISNHLWDLIGGERTAFSASP